MGSEILMGMMLCSLVNGYQDFRRNCYPHIQGRRDTRVQAKGNMDSNQGCISHWLACSYNSCPIFPLSMPTISYVAYKTTLKMKASGFSNTLVLFYQATWHYIPGDKDFLF
jgi:hypothetical protein